MHRLVVVTALCSCGMPILLGQPVLHLKARAATGGSLTLASSLEDPAGTGPKRLEAGRRYRILQFAAAPSGADVQELEAQGARVLQYVPDHALLVNLPEPFETGAKVVYMDALQASDKWSPEWSAAGAAAALSIAELTKPGEDARQRAVAEFYPDVTAGAIRQIAAIEGLRVIEHTDLTARNLLVEGTEAQLRSLAGWDEVAYLYPASADLTAGRAVHRCEGGMTGVGAVGQYVAKIGDGWDGAGKNAATLRYVIAGMTKKLPAEDATREIERALAEWSKAVKVDFTRSEQAGEQQRRQIEILFARGAHGDPYAFDGPGRVLAHTFYPAPPNAEPLAGDLHLDDDEGWRIGNDIDLYSVVLHELGHALGLGHSDRPGAVMYAYYRQLSTLTAEDIGAARELYAAREAGTETPAPAPAPTPTTPPAQPPAAPTPPPAPAPAPAPTPAADRTPPSVTVTSPSGTSVSTSAATIKLTGTASDNVGVAKVTVTSNVSGTQTAAGTTRWTAELALAVGYNNIVVRAYDAAGNSSWRSLVVTRK